MMFFRHAKVMEKEKVLEALNSSNGCFFAVEFRYGIPTQFFTADDIRRWMDNTNYKDEYKKSWRCWSKIPSAKELKRTKWEEK